MTETVNIAQLRQHFRARTSGGSGTVALAIVGVLGLIPFGSEVAYSAAATEQVEEAAPKTPDKKTPEVAPIAREGTMTLERMDEIIKRLDEKAKSTRKGLWQFEIQKRTVMIVTDLRNDRMRIMAPIGPVANVSVEQMKRLMQANFDTALDSRYAVAQEILWATYIHPLKALHDRQFVAAIGQTVNLVSTFGTTYSSGLLSFGGGDSQGIIQRQLIDGLLKKGLPI